MNTVKCEVIQKLQCDILCLCETWLRDSDAISIPGYKWFGQNRKQLSKRANRGSGGVGILIRNSLSDISVMDSSVEGILWLKIVESAKPSCVILCVCVCYLPPSTSSRGDSSDHFFDCLATQIFTYRHLGCICICGDFNARCAVG